MVNSRYDSNMYAGGDNNKNNRYGLVDVSGLQFEKGT